MEYDKEIQELTGIDISEFDGVIRCPNCGLPIEANEESCDNCGCLLIVDE